MPRSLPVSPKSSSRAISSTMVSALEVSPQEADRLRSAAETLGPWFHNYEIARGVFTNGLGAGPGADYPARRWEVIEPLLPDVRGKTCLDVGCSSGFFSLKLKELGAASVLGIDFGEQVRAIEQAKFAAKCLRLDVEFQTMSVYDAAQLDGRFDLILFMGVLYHLRHPMVALEALRAVARGAIVLQTITSGSESGSSGALAELQSGALADVDLRGKPLKDERFPTLRFVEGKLNGDASCWFVPNPQAVAAMMRASGFSPDRFVFPPSEVYVVGRAV